MTREEIRQKAAIAARDTQVMAHAAWCKHARAAAKNPHHYITAAGVSIFLLWLGYSTELLTVWAYAFIETIVTGVDA